MNAQTTRPGPTPKRRVLRVALVGFASLVVALGVLAATFSPSWLLTPSEPFDAADTPTAPDYGTERAWAALPSTEDHADLRVSMGSGALKSPGDETTETDGERGADVFYVHPTTYFSRERWNAPIDEPTSSELLDEVVLAAEASVFAACCRVFAPRYRQATLGTFYAERSDAQQALSLAFGDVQAAFAAFLRRVGDRPFILAGHSQGSMHLLRLLEQIDGDDALRRRLVVAYLPGFAVPTSWYRERYQHLRPCERPEQTGCVAAWDTYRDGAKVGGADPLMHWQGSALVRVPPTAPRQCTNPVTWADGDKATAEQHRGAVGPAHAGEPPGFVDLLMASEPLGIEVTGLRAYPDVRVAARCEAGVLRVPDLGELGFPEQETEPGNYHLHDFELFAADIAANASLRVAAYAAARKP